jgi:hypothetical protein
MKAQIRRLYLSLFSQKSVWLPTGRGWMVLAFLLGGSTLFCGSRAHSFLAVSQPVQANILILEGWTADYVVQDAVREFQRGKYDYLCATGGPLEKGRFFSRYQSEAELTVASLQALHFPPEKIIEASATNAWRNRTFVSAQAAKAKLEQMGIPVQGVNVITVGAHARRTLAVYRKVFRPPVPVGVISRASEDYDGSAWWRSSEGVKSVLTEGLGWTYEWLFNAGRSENP